LSMLPSGFNNSNYIIIVVKINTTRMDTPRIGKINKLLVMYCSLSVCLLTTANSCTGSHPGHEEALRTRYLNPSSLEGVDALLVIGAGQVEDQLLLLRFFLPEPIFQDGDWAFVDFMANSKGWVARRTGGSSGPTVFNRDMWDFLHLPGTLPRKTYGTVIIQTETKYFLYYCSPYETDRTVKCAHYWQPHPGGKCNKFSAEFIELHPGLRRFASSKIAAAYLLNAMEPQFCIAKEAVLVEQKKIQASITNGGLLGSKAFFVEFIGTHCEHTIVCHPVGYHNDVFKNGMTNYLENRVVLECRNFSRPVNYPLGRGGLENGTYTWALLDW
jgi:hypothetical protein